MLRVLIADDQIPDVDLSEEQVLAEAKKEYPDAHQGFIDAFRTMRLAVLTMRDGFDVTVARRYSDALNLVRSERFDVAIIDLGWTGDRAVPHGNADTAGWTIIEAIQDEDAHHPERRPTAQIIYSARFATHPDLSQDAAAKGILPFYKPYGELHSIPLGGDKPRGPSVVKQELAACKSLRAVVAFIGHLREEPNPYSDVERLLQAAHEGLVRANAREKTWDRLTRTLITIGVLIVFAGVGASLFGGVPQGAVTAASGVVVALIPRLMFRQLDKVREEIKNARSSLDASVAKARDLDSQSSRATPQAPDSG